MCFRSLFRWIFLFASLKFEFLTECPKETNCQDSEFAVFSHVMVIVIILKMSNTPEKLAMKLVLRYMSFEIDSEPILEGQVLLIFATHV